MFLDDVQELRLGEDASKLWCMIYKTNHIGACNIRYDIRIPAILAAVQRLWYWQLKAGGEGHEFADSPSFGLQNSPTRSSTMAVFGGLPCLLGIDLLDPCPARLKQKIKERKERVLCKQMLNEVNNVRAMTPVAASESSASVRYM